MSQNNCMAVVIDHAMQCWHIMTQLFLFTILMIRRCLYRKYPFKIYYDAGVHLQYVHMKSEIEAFIWLGVAHTKWVMALIQPIWYVFYNVVGVLQWNGGVDIKSEIEAFIWLGVILIKWGESSKYFDQNNWPTMAIFFCPKRCAMCWIIHMKK